ncbi:MAG: hypothetical protein GX308_01825 [Epulopiscium sp.]|nr:hypothetical protein [Candidatus Epulonipiscium sp.]
MYAQMKESKVANCTISRNDKMIIPRIRERIEHLERRMHTDWYDPIQLYNDIINLKKIIDNLIEKEEIKREDIPNEYTQIIKLLNMVR